MSLRVTIPTTRPRGDRRAGWTAFPIRCPRCHSFGRTSQRLKDVAFTVNGGGLRCEHCASVWFVIPITRLQIAFVAEVTVDDIRTMEDQHMTLEQSLAYLGASFPYSEKPAA